MLTLKCSLIHLSSFCPYQNGGDLYVSVLFSNWSKRARTHLHVRGTVRVPRYGSSHRWPLDGAFSLVLAPSVTATHFKATPSPTMLRGRCRCCLSGRRCSNNAAFNGAELKLKTHRHRSLVCRGDTEGNTPVTARNTGRLVHGVTKPVLESVFLECLCRGE